jgi:hypothetical protein
MTYRRWSSERDARLLELYAAASTWSEIAQAIGVTRGAAVARGHRLGLRDRAKVGKAAQGVPEAAEGHLLPHHDVIARSTAVRRESGHALPVGSILTWSLIICHTPVLGDVPWPE